MLEELLCLLKQAQTLPAVAMVPLGVRGTLSGPLYLDLSTKDSGILHQSHHPWEASPTRSLSHPSLSYLHSFCLVFLTVTFIHLWWYLTGYHQRRRALGGQGPYALH